MIKNIIYVRSKFLMADPNSFCNFLIYFDSGYCVDMSKYLMCRCKRLEERETEITIDEIMMN